MGSDNLLDRPSMWLGYLWSITIPLEVMSQETCLEVFLGRTFYRIFTL